VDWRVGELEVSDGSWRVGGVGDVGDIEVWEVLKFLEAMNALQTEDTTRYGDMQLAKIGVMTPKSWQDDCRRSLGSQSTV
jgi:hypothetical protein